MNLRKLQERIETSQDTFLKEYQTISMNEEKNVQSIAQKFINLLENANRFANNNDLDYKYLEVAKAPLWSDFEVEPESFIYQGFDAKVVVDLSENLNNLKPFVIVQNNNVKDLKEGQRFEINDDFIKTMNPLQQEIFKEALEAVENRATTIMKKVWKVEQQRLDKWVKTSKIVLKGN